MTTVYEFPAEWYRFTSATFRIQPTSLVTPRTFLRGKNVKGPYAAVWIGEFSLTPKQDPDRQQIAAFFSRLDGQAGLLRMGDPTKPRPYYDRNLVPSTQNWSDGSGWSDGTLFSSGFLPSDIFVAAAAKKGDNALVLGGLPVSLAGCFIPGDVFQVKPNGIAGSVPHFYEIQVGGATNASGQIGVEIRPRLRADLAFGDQVTLKNPTSVFRLIDDDQGVLAMSGRFVGSGGFKVVEALDQIA